MSYRHIYYNQRGGEICLHTWNDEGDRVVRKIPYKPYLYIESQNIKDAVSIFGTPLRKMVFKNQFERHKYVETSGIKRIFYNLMPEQQYLVDNYKFLNEQPEFYKHPLKIYYIDIECYSPLEFPKANEAKHPINLITVYDTLAQKHHTWGLSNAYTGEHNNNNNYSYYRFNTEEEMLRSFVRFIEDDYPDIISGWNCIEENQHIWLADRITKIKDISNNYENKPLKKYGLNISNYMNTGKKDEYELKTEHGDTILSSIDHRFMVYKVEKGKYKNYNTLTKDIVEMSVNDILLSQEKYNIYVKKHLGNNTNPPLTYGDIIEKYKHQLKQHIISEDAVHTTFNFTNKKRLSDNFKISKNENITPSILGLIGFIFTDGSFDKNEKTFRITNKYKDTISAYTDIFNREHNKALSSATKCVTNFNKKTFTSYTKQIGLNNKLGILMNLVYDENGHKKPDIETISRLSYKQFMKFLSGMIDGDGWVQSNGVSICNYDCQKYNFLQDLHELLLWNGMQTRVFDNYLTINANNINEPHLKQLDLQQHKRKNKLKKIKYKQIKNSISNKIQWMYKDDEYVVKLQPIRRTGRIVNMYDIETKTHTFLCNGILTHNCEGFDIPYIVNRINRLLGEPWKNRLSPGGSVYFREIKRFNKSVPRWFIKGMSCIDYMEAYKLFSRNEQESYSLDYISKQELGTGKIQINATSLAQLSIDNWNDFVDYNVRDVDLIVSLDNKLKLMSLVRMLSYKGLTNFESAFGKVSVIAGALAVKAHERGLIIPTFVHDKMSRNPGGFVKLPEPGLHEGIVSFDANSLYPNTIITLNVSPETKLGTIKSQTSEEVEIKLVSGKQYKLTLDQFSKFVEKEKIAISKAKVLYTQNSKGLCPELIEKLYHERVEFQKQIKQKEEELKQIKEEIKRRNKNLISEIHIEKTLEQLEGMRDNLEKTIEDYDLNQYVLKIFLNSIYGTFANEFSPLYDTESASSITLTGQACVKQSAKIVNDYMKTTYNINEDCIIYNDTDSYVGDTVIRTNIGALKAEDLHDYYSQQNCDKKLSAHGHETISVEDKNLKCLTFNSKTNEVEWKNIKRLIRHKTAKKKYKIKVNGKEIIMTEDHGCMVVRDDKLIRISPKDIKSGDKIINIYSDTD